jgi:dihydropteroate synthase
MAEPVLFLTGHLAEPRLRRVLEGLGDLGFAWKIVNIGVKVAALMTEPIILRRLKQPLAAARVVLPGRAGADPARLSAAFGVPFERGPEEVADLPRYLGRGAKPADLSRHDTRIFAEIVDAPSLSFDAILARAEAYRKQGADVIDIGCKPGTAFPDLEAAITGLRARGFTVSADSGNPDELRRAALAGADYLLSLTEDTLWVAEGTEAVPVLIPAAHGDLDSLVQGAARFRRRCLLDPILDPIHFGFMESLQRYAALRARLPEAEILMGTGNLTELTDADSAGVTAVLMGICSELAIRNVLVVQVSPHTRRTVAEHDLARRIMFAARQNADLPRGYDEGLLQTHDRRPFIETAADIEADAGATRDANWRIVNTVDGITVYNNQVRETGQDAFGFFPSLGVADDGAHAFYLGAELTKAEIAWRLGKRYTQDAPLDFGVAAPRSPSARTRLAQAGHTLRGKKAADGNDP